MRVADEVSGGGWVVCVREASARLLMMSLLLREENQQSAARQVPGSSRQEWGGREREGEVVGGRGSLQAAARRLSCQVGGERAGRR